MDVFVDTHCHLNLNLFQDDLPEVLDRAGLLGVERILVPGVDLETSRRAVLLAEEYPNLFAAVGVHPNDAATWTGSSLAELRALARSPRVLAIGEIGLDYYRNFAPPQLQKEILMVQLDLAKEVDKPVVIHSRQSLSDLWQILSSWIQGAEPTAILPLQSPGVLHSFDGDLETALQAIKKGFMIGVSGPVTFHNALERQEIVSGLPLANILIETDAPYLTPHPYRGRRNEPAYVVYVAEKIAAIKGLSISEVAAVTTSNADRIFGWRTND